MDTDQGLGVERNQTIGTIALVLFAREMLEVSRVALVRRERLMRRPAGFDGVHDATALNQPRPGNPGAMADQDSGHLELIQIEKTRRQTATPCSYQ